MGRNKVLVPFVIVPLKTNQYLIKKKKGKISLKVITLI